MRPTRFRGVIGFGDQKYVERMSNCRIRIADPEAGDLHSRDGQCRPEAHGALPFQAFGEGSNPVGDAARRPDFGRAFSSALYWRLLSKTTLPPRIVWITFVLLMSSGSISNRF